MRAADAASEGVVLEGRLLESITVRGLHWQGQSFRRLRARHVTFVDCTFSGVTFEQASLVDVTFENCTLRACSLGQARFERCRFVGGTLEGGRARAAVLAHCEFESVNVQELLLEEGHVDVVQRGGRVSKVGFSECDVHRWALTGTELSDVRFTACRGGPVQLEECRIEGLVFLGGQWSALKLRRGSFSNLSFAEIEVQRLLIEHGAFALGVHVDRCVLGEFTVSRCPRVSDLYVSASTLGRFELSHGTFDGWVTGCELGPDSSVRDATLVGLFWDNTVSDEFTFSAVVFQEAICARNARFVRMRLVDPVYEPNLALVLEGATFEESDHFGSGAP